MSLSGFAEAARADRAWDFELDTPGTYKVQIEHRTSNTGSGRKVFYSVTIGGETQSREIELVARRPLVPLVVEVPTAQRMRVLISGLARAELQKTRVYVYDAHSLPQGQHFDPAVMAASREVATIERLLRSHSIDLAVAKLTIDKLIDSSINISADLRKIEAMAARIRAMPEFGGSAASKLNALKRYIYEPGPWNDYRAFRYDFDDPFGKDIRNKLLTTYMASRKGNCVSMPFLFIILAQRLGIEVTAATAPMHVFAKFKTDEGTSINLETTSGANPARDIWVRQQFDMTDDAVANGLYLQPLSRKETVALMATTLSEYYMQQGEYEKAIQVSALVLRYYRKDVSSMVRTGAAYGRMVNSMFIGKYASPSQIPASEKSYFEYLSRQNQFWYAKAEALGWRQEQTVGAQRYLKDVERIRKLVN